MKLFRQSFGEGPPLLIIHGLLGASGNWQSLAKNRFSAHFRTTTIDLRNHGRSPHSVDFSYSDMAEDILELMEDEGMRDAHVLGHSMGGKLAMYLALEHQEIIDKLIVADIAPRAYNPRHETIFRALHEVQPALFDSRAEVDAAMQHMIPEPGLRQFLLKNLHRDESGLAWKMNLPAIESHYPEILSEIESWDVFEGDVLFIRGERSDYLSEADVPSIQALFPFAEHVSMPDAGHWLHADNPNLFADLTLKFLL